MTCGSVRLGLVQLVRVKSADLALPRPRHIEGLSRVQRASDIGKDVA
jgi:hypothetical protein